MSLPWYLKPIRPSRLAWIGHALPGTVLLILFVSAAVSAPSARPIEFQGPWLVVLAASCWPLLAWRIARLRRDPPMSIPGLVLTSAALTVLAIPALLWPSLASNLPDTEAVPALVSVTTRLSWCASGLLMAIGLYLILSYTRRPSAG